MVTVVPPELLETLAMEPGGGWGEGTGVGGRPRATPRLYAAPFGGGERLAAPSGDTSPAIIQGRKRERGRWSPV